MRPRLLVLASLLGLLGAVAAWADLALVRERLAALRQDPVRELSDAEHRKELAFFWAELARHDAQLPPALRLLRPRLVMIGERERIALLGRLQNLLRKEYQAAMALALQAALLAHEDLLTEGSYQRPSPEEARAVLEATLPRFQGPTDERNRIPRAVALAVLAEVAFPGDPGREALGEHRLVSRQARETFGRGLRGVVAPFSPALGAAMDRDLEALRTALAPPAPSPPTPSPSPSASPAPSPPVTSPTPSPPPAAPEPRPRPRPRPRRLRWLLILAALAGTGGLGYAAARMRQVEPEAAPAPAPPAPEPASPPASSPAPSPASLIAADRADTDPPGRPSEPPDEPPAGPDPLPLLHALEQLRGRVVHSLTGRFAIAKVLEDEPDRFAEAFLTDATLRESAELLEGLLAALDELPEGPADLTRHVEKLRAASPRYAKLARFLSRARDEVASGRRPRDMAEFQRRLVTIAAHFKEINKRLRQARAAYQVDLEELLEDRGEAFRGRLDVQVGGPGETDLLRTAATSARADLGLVLDILLENSFQAKARTVTATFEDAGVDTVRVVLVDDGEGLPDHSPDELMRSGFSTKALGTGTGLSQARRLALTHGGTVALASDEGGGARVTLEIAAAPPSH